MPPMMPPGMPPGMPPQGGMPSQAPPMGGAIAQILGQLMNSPAAMQGIMNFMQGQSPTAGMPMPPSAGGPPPQGGPVPMPQGGPPMPPDVGPPMPQGPPVDQAEQMAQKQIDSAGATWDGVDAPTKNDIERLKEDPSETNIESFDEQFGKGMAEKYIGDQSDSDPEDKTDQGTDENSEPEYDQ